MWPRGFLRNCVYKFFNLSFLQSFKNIKFLQIPALIPFIDLANHEHSTNKSASVFLDCQSGNVHLQIKQNLSISKEIFIHYGARSNSKFLLHNGFVPKNTNPDNFYELKLGKLNA